jgi:hypothetical protein
MSRVREPVRWSFDAPRLAAAFRSSKDRRPACYRATWAATYPSTSRRGSLPTANDNEIGANLQAFKNTGGLEIFRNGLDGNLRCKENNPAPIGGGNVVQGNKEDRCSRL